MMNTTQKEPDSPPSRPRRKVRWLRAVLCGAVGLVAIWLVAINAWLALWAEDLLNRRPEKLNIKFDRAWSFWPSRIQARGLQISVQSRRNQWQLDLEEAQLHIVPQALRKREFILRSASGQGTTFLLRTRPQSEEELLSANPDIPPIEQFEFSLAQPQEQAKAKKKRWRISLNNVNLAGVRQLWFDRVNLLTDPESSTARGNLDIVMRDALALDDVDLRIGGGTLSVAGQPVAEGLDLAALASLSPTTSRSVKDPRTYENLAAKITANGDLLTLSFLRKFMQTEYPFAIEGAGKFDSAVFIEAGKIVEGSELSITTPSLRADIGSFVAVGGGVLSGSVSDSSESSLATLRLKLSDVEVDRGAEQTAGGIAELAQANELDLVLTASDPVLGVPLVDPRILVELPSLIIPRLANFSDLIPAGTGLDIVGGSGRAVTRLELSKGSERSQFELVADDAELLFRGTRVAGTLTVSGNTEGNRESGTLSLRNVRTAFDGSTKPSKSTVPAGPVAFDFRLADTTLWFPTATNGTLKDLGEGMRLGSGPLSITGTINDLGWWETPIKGVNWLRLGGEATVQADLQLAGTGRSTRLTAGSAVKLDFPSLGLGLGAWKAQSAGLLEGSIRRKNSSRTRMESTLTLRLLQPTMARGKEEPFVLPSLLLKAQGPSLAHGLSSPDVSVAVSIAKTAISDLSRFNDYLPADKVQLTSGSGSLDGAVSIRRNRVNANLKIDSPNSAFTLLDMPIEGSVDLDTVLDSSDVNSGRFSLDGSTLRLTDVAFPSLAETANPSRGWWAVADLQQGSVVEITQPLKIDAQVQLRLRDTEPIVHLVSQSKRKVRWFSRLLEVQDVTGTARMILDAQGLRLHDLLIVGDGLDIKGRIDLREKTAALLLIRLHGLRAGIEINGDWNDVNVLRPEAWFRERTQVWNGTAPN